MRDHRRDDAREQSFRGVIRRVTDAPTPRAGRFGGMVTTDGSRFKEKKDNGLVKDVFDKRTMNYLDGNIGLGHVRYPTQGGLSATEKQPFLNQLAARNLFNP